MVQRGWPKLRRFRIWLLTMLSLLGVTVVVAAVMANPSFPETPELEAISLELPRTEPPSRRLSALLETARKLRFDLEKPPIKAAVDAVKTGRWLDDPAEVMAALDRLDRPSLSAFHAALMERGCLPQEELKVDAERYSFLNLMRGSRLVAIRAVALAQTGQPAQALAYLAPVHDRLQQLEERCAPNLIGTMVLEASLSHIRPAWGHLLAGDLPADLRQQVWRRIRSLESRKNPLPDALRQEERFLDATLASVKQQANKSAGEARLTSWPWFDVKETLKLQRMLGRRRIWLAGQPLDSETWTRTFPEQEYFDKIREAPRWLVLLRYNGTGKTLLAMAAPSYTQYVLKWHQNRCLAAAQRARWARELKARGRTPIKDATTPAPRDPFTRQAFGTGDKQCAVPDRLMRGASGLEAQWVAPLPPPPSRRDGGRHGLVAQPD